MNEGHAKSMATTEARRALPQLVKQMGAKRKPSANLLHDAVDIGPHRKGGAVLLPEVDVTAHAAEVAKLRARVAELEDELEDAGMALFLQDRLASTSGARLTTEEFLTGIGMQDRIERLPER
jgi:polyhydroxyalkanoate synthesis regulator phasin